MRSRVSLASFLDERPSPAADLLSAGVVLLCFIAILIVIASEVP